MEQATQKKKKKHSTAGKTGASSVAFQQKEEMSREEKSKLLKRYQFETGKQESKEKGLNEAVHKDRDRQVAGDDVALDNRNDLKSGSLQRKEDPEKVKARKKFQDREKKLNTRGYMTRLERARKELGDAAAENDRQLFERKLKDLKAILSEMQQKVRETIGEAKAAGFLESIDQHKTLRKMEEGLTDFSDFTEETLEELSAATENSERTELLTELFGNVWEFVGLASAWNEQDWGDRLRDLDQASEEFEGESVLEPVFERYRFAEYKDEVTRNARGLVKQNMTGMESREAAHRLSKMMGLDPTNTEDIEKMREKLSHGKRDIRFTRDVIDRYLGLDRIMDKVKGEFSGLNTEQKAEILDEIRAFTERKLGIQNDEILAERIVRDAPEELVKEERERARWMEYSKQLLEEEEETAAGVDDGRGAPPPADNGFPGGSDDLPEDDENGTNTSGDGDETGSGEQTETEEQLQGDE